MIFQKSFKAENNKKNTLSVSMGGATGLFIGASLLSFVEIVYYFTIRPYSSMVMMRTANDAAAGDG